MADVEATAAPPAAAKSSKKATAAAAASKAKKPKAKPSHPPTSDMVNAAIKNLKERGGSSLQAIKKYISATYKVDADKLSPFIRKYLKSAVTSGSLVQTKGKGASGSFKLPTTAAPAKKKADKPASPKKAKAAAAPKPKAKPASPKKAKAKKAPAKKAAPAPVAASPKAKSPKAKKSVKTPTKKPKAPKPKKVKVTKKASPKKK